MTALETASGAAKPWRLGARLAAIAALIPLEIVTLDFFYDVHAVAGEAATPAWLFANLIIKSLAYAALYACAAFTLTLWPQRRALAAAWREAAIAQPRRGFVALNLVSFAVLLAATLALRGHNAGTPWLSFVLWLAGVALMLAPLVLAAAPWRFWARLAVQHRVAAFASAIAGVAIAWIAMLAQDSWRTLAGATLQLSYTLLHLVERDAFIDASRYELGARQFRVIVDSYCSGYEGVGLVLSALALFLWLFRAQLRFPRALLLLPLGATAIWLLNAVRIAFLVEMGAHWSSQAAIDGFHSQAGWILFVGVTGGLMAWAHGSTFFRADAPVKKVDPAIRLATALLAPFAALMAARVTASSFGADAHWIAAGVIVLPCLALVLNRQTLRPLFGTVKLEAVAIGLIVGALWIATEPAHDAKPLGAWLAGQTSGDATAWLALRVFGFALIVPLAEELVFRGYLHRALVARRFEEAAPSAFSWLAFLATSLLFGAMHGRWMAGAFAGAAYALCLYRSKSLSGPVAAHIASNGLIAAYALTQAQWGLL